MAKVIEINVVKLQTLEFMKRRAVMKIRMNLERALFSFIMLYPLIHLALTTFAPTMSTKIVLVFLGMLYYYFSKHTTIKEFLIVNVLIILYALYNIANYHIYQVMHSDFYTFVLLGLIFVVYSKKGVVDRFFSFLRLKEKMFRISEMLFFLILLYSMLFARGLQTGFGSKIPVLYGPYSVPHMLGYVLITMYCLNAFFQRMSKKNTFLFFKVLCVVLAVWTAARSAVLGMAIIVFADYISIRNLRKKYMILGAGVLVALYMIFFTDILINNPLIQKTMSSMENGSVTNGREWFSQIALNYYSNNTTFLEKLFGIGMNNVRSIFLHTPTIGVAIHAHNEYVNTLVGYGAIGLVIYIINQLKQMRVLVDWKMKLLIQCFIFILAYYNGFAMYAMFTPCLVIIITFMNQNYFTNNVSDLTVKKGETSR